MKLVPAATVSVIYSEKMNVEMRKPRFSVVEGCIYNQTGSVEAKIGGTADVEVVPPNDLMNYIQYRLTAVE